MIWRAQCEGAKADIQAGVAQLLICAGIPAATGSELCIATYIQYLVEDLGKPAQEDNGPDVLKPVALEADAHPDADCNADQEANEQEVEACQEEGVAMGCHELVELDEVDNLPPPGGISRGYQSWIEATESAW
jgi:hypothetical protein